MSEALPGSTSGYRAFLSYSHADAAWADWLHNALEAYRVPARLVGIKTAAGEIPRRLSPIFRDREELASATDLGREVNEALAQSAALIVVCSPHAARSRWVNEEVLAYKRLGHGERIFCLIVDGEPGVSEWPGHEAAECFCPALRHVVDANGQLTSARTEPIAADVRPARDGKAHARLKLVAGLLDIGYDTLVQRDAHRRRRRLLTVTAASMMGMGIATVLALSAVAARNEARQRQAQTEEVLNFMLGDLHEKLEAMGRLDLMAAVTDKALALFADSKPGALTDNELTQQSRALVQVGEIRLQEARYGPAMDAFQRAYQRSAELAARHPRNGQFLFDRAQAEYWIGNVYHRQQKMADAETWLTHYRDSTRALVEIDPGNRDWQLEATYGEHNLAVLALDRGGLDAAQHGFEAELAVLKRFAGADPHDTELASQVADTVSWLGSVAERRGDLASAQRLFGEQARQSALLRDRHPDDYRLLRAWATAQKLLAMSLGATDRHEESRRILAEAAGAYETLTKHDPDNVQWQVDLASVQVLRASHALAVDNTAETEHLLAAAMGRLSVSARPTSTQGERFTHQVLSRAWLLRAHLASRRGDAYAAQDAAVHALAQARDETISDAVDDSALADQADALLVLGMAQQAHSPGVSPPAWAQARALLAPRIPGSHFWRVLDPWVRLCRLTGDVAGEQVALDRLNASGYAPLFPWPPGNERPTPVVTRGEPSWIRQPPPRGSPSQ